MPEKRSFHTFVVMAREGSPYLDACVLSLVNQTVRSPIVIYTATASNHVAAISKKYEIPVLIHPVGGNMIDVWNFAYNNCESEYVTLVHEDDVYLPRYNEICFSYLNAIKNGESLILFTWYNDFINGKESVCNIKLLIKKLLLFPAVIKSAIRSRFLKKAMLLFGSPIPCPSVMYHKGRIGPFYFSKTFNCDLDWDAWLRLSERDGSFIFVNKKLLLHRIHHQSLTSQLIDSNGRRDEDLRIFRRLWPEPMARMLSALYALSYRMNNAG
ncbi:MAG TPA: glycosyltransferase family 2 protein [Candidatus Omnitrophota bacterium]|nr:glycosyltransferase family 2 protein [Candidatus Omnitrophota bacterium]HPT07591.1 glycosyltransferase family 2 protein [Candidatus Omnitrophota bacterium]